MAAQIPIAVVRADEGSSHLRAAQVFYREGQYYKAARFAFAAAHESSESLRHQAYALTAMGLIQSGLPQSASYFFIKTLMTEDRSAIRRMLTQTQTLVAHVGSDLVRKYLVRYATLDDFDGANRGVYLYLVGKEALLSGQEGKAVDVLSAVDSENSFYGYSQELLGAAYAIRGENESALQAFGRCVASAKRTADRMSEMERGNAQWVKKNQADAEDLKNRCQAGLARTYYQMGSFEQADRAYDRISKSSLVWTDILFEQAWNAFAQQEYNRSLGKLISYKSPALRFVFNSEIDVLRAQSYLAFCLYSDANGVINEFNSRYVKIGEDVKRLVESHSGDLTAFYRLGREGLADSLHSSIPMHQLLNRFVRGPYFQTQVNAEKEIGKEWAAAEHFSRLLFGASNDPGHGFTGFLRQVLSWRAQTVRSLGGAYVKNSLMDYHSVLLSDFEKMAFIKLEMLSRAKEKLIQPDTKFGDRNRNQRDTSRKDYQYYWSFNGEFWNDELGDYVFGLESACGV